MKQRIRKRVLSALCLMLALCMASYPAALAQETSADSSDDAIAAADSSEDGGTDSSAEASSEEESPVPEDDMESAEAEAELTEAADETESDPSNANDDAESGTEEGASVSDASAQEENDALTDEAASSGWTRTDTGWAFCYWQTETASEPVQAAGAVLYLPEDSTVGETTFAAGYYYFNDEGELTLTGTGLVTVLRLEGTSGKMFQDESAESSGKLAAVTTTQSDSGYSSAAAFYTGSYGGVFYSNGELYTGFYVNPTTGILYYMTDGTYVRYTGKYDASSADTYGDTTFTGDGLWYYKGETFTGYVRRYSGDCVWVVTNGVGGTKLTGKMDAGTVYVRMDTGAQGSGDGLWYYSGSKFTGYVRRYSGDYVWVVTNGKGGTKLTGIASTSKYYVRMDTGKRTKAGGKCYSKGVLYTGGYNGYYYKKGVKQTGLSGWKTFSSSGSSSSKSSDNTYYFSGGKYVTGWKTLTRNGSKYRFYFNSDGTLCKNIYKVYSAYKKKSTQLVVNRGAQTATLYAKYNGSYMLPCKSFVVSTARLDSNYKAGTYKITKRMSWFPYGSWYYKWACYLSGSGAWTHSEQYYTKGDHYSLNVSSYNNLGTKQSLRCVRMQVVNCKLIYDMAGGGYIKQVVLTKSSNAGPFGKMTITDNVDKSGKLSGSRSYDPTDPAVA